MTGGRIYLANVGANASHRFAGPVFPNGRFEFLPIPESPDLPGPLAVRYGDLRSFYDPDQSLAAYFPERVRALATHNDPEFETFTYGDNCEANARAAGLKSAGPGDYLVFLVRLAEWSGGSPKGPTGRHGFYLVGVLRVEGVMKGVRSRPTDDVIRAFKKMPTCGGGSRTRRCGTGSGCSRAARALVASPGRSRSTKRCARGFSQRPTAPPGSGPASAQTCR